MLRILSLAFILLTTATLPSRAQQVTVSSKCDLFLAGQQQTPANEPWLGLVPVAISLNGARFVYIDTTIGKISCAETLNPADGGFCVSDETDINSANGIAGVIHHGKVMFLAAVFVNDAELDNQAPERLDCTQYNNFPELRPGLEQIFFVGDGKNAKRVRQRIAVPEGATTLYLGFADAPAFHGDFGTYDDNDGTLKVTVRPAAE